MQMEVLGPVTSSNMADIFLDFSFFSTLFSLKI